MLSHSSNELAESPSRFNSAIGTSGRSVASAHAGSPEDKARLKEYESGPTASLAKEIMKGFELTAAPDADVLDVAKAIVKIVDMPFGTRPFRVHIDPAQDGAEIVNGVADRVRAELLRNMQLADLLRSSSTKVPTQKAS